MEKDRSDLLHLLLQPYTIEVMKAMIDQPKRFMDLKRYVKNEMTLSTKLSKLLKNGLIEFAPVLTEEGYVNAYKISAKGKRVLKGLHTLGR